jgi:hypothetical protein
MRITTEFWSAISATVSAFVAITAIYSLNRESRIRRSGSISLSTINDYSGTSPQKYLVISNLGQSTARDTHISVNKSDTNWKIELVGSDEEFETCYRFNLGDLSPNASAKRRIFISFGDVQESDFVGTATWRDYRKNNKDPFSIRPTIF